MKPALCAIALLLSVSARAMSMTGMDGPYPMTREATGTAWQPDSTPHQGLHVMYGGWMAMVHGFAAGIYDRQGGPRGRDQTFSSSMLMLMAQHPLWGGTFGAKSMVSLDPAMGPRGYPMLFQTGETADGQTGLVDRQHPHDLLMELAGSYSRPVSGELWAFGYFGLPGEPALGPPAFMHRFSALDNPEAPITHHWLDSTHITYGVATAGAVWREWKLEGSTFRGREPDRYRWDLEKPSFDSYSARLSWNPTEDWSLQASYGRLVSPEQLEPDVDQGRFTASASWNWVLGLDPGQTTLAFGQNRNKPGRRLDAWLLESALRFHDRASLFTRLERVEKDELFDSGPNLGRVFTVNKLSVGSLYDFARWRRTQWGVGGLGSVEVIPVTLRPVYGRVPLSLMIFARVKII